MIALNPTADSQPLTFSAELSGLILSHRVSNHFELLKNRLLISLLLTALMLFLLNQLEYPTFVLGLWALSVVVASFISLWSLRHYAQSSEIENEKHWLRLSILLNLSCALPWILLPWLFLSEMRSETLLLIFMGILLVSTGIFFVPANFSSNSICIILIFSSFCFRCLFAIDELGAYTAILAITSCTIILLSLRGLHLNFIQQMELENTNQALIEEAHRANQTKLKFLSTASHDLRQPVYSLSILLNIFSKRYKTHDQKLTRLMNASLSSMQGMLSSLLDFSKLDAGEMKPVLSSVNINELVQDLKTEFKVQLDESQNRLLNNTHSIQIRTDREMLNSILRNLISNSTHHCKNGLIEIKTRIKGESLLLIVADQGAGIPKPQREKVFNEFYQLKSARKDNNEGLGLGLSIVKRLCILLGYAITVESHDKGTEFILLIPFRHRKGLLDSVKQSR